MTCPGRPPRPPLPLLTALPPIPPLAQRRKVQLSRLPRNRKKMAIPLPLTVLTRQALPTQGRRYADPPCQAKKEAAEYLEALQRERAEFINFRNRAQKEQERFRQHGIIDVLTALLPALDDIDRIREHSEMDDSFKAVANKIDKAFEKFGVEKFGEKGEDFDPTKHDAILHKPDPNAEKETVDTVVEAGYRIGDRVIRAARVVVASPQN